MITQFDSVNKLYYVFDRYGEQFGLFALRDGGWEFVKDDYNSSDLTNDVRAVLDKVQMELNI